MADSSYIKTTSDPLIVTDSQVNNIDVATDEEGNFVVAWQTEDNIEFQRYEANGSTIGDPVTLATLEESSPQSVAIAMSADGEFAITYDIVDLDEGDREIDVQLFDASGEQKEDAILVTNNDVDDRNPDIAMTNDGEFLLTWEQYDNGEESNIVLNSYDREGELLDSDQITEGVDDAYDPAIAIVNSDVSEDDVSGVISYTQDSGSSEDRFDVVYQVLSGPDFQGSQVDNVLENPQGDQGQSAVGIDEDGNAVIAWSDKFSEIDQVYAIKRKNNGEISTANVSQDTEKQDNNPTVAVADDGSFLVAYRAEDDEQVKIQEYNTDAEAVGDPLETGELQLLPSLEVTGDGKSLILAGVDNENQAGVLLYEKSGSQSNGDSVGIDFNRDGNSDILWRNLDDGDNRVWLMDGVELNSEEFIQAEEDLNWYIGGVGDFNGDDNDDIIWGNSRTRAVGVWYMDGVDRIDTGNLPRVNSRDLEVKGVADFNDDDSDDLILRNRRTGANQIWYMDGEERIRVKNIKKQGNTRLDIYGLADFDNNGDPDIVWRDQRRTGRNQIWLMEGDKVIKTVNITNQRDLDEYIGGTGDFNKDGNADIVFGNRDTGANEVWLMNGFEGGRLRRTDIVSIPSESNGDWMMMNG